MNQEEAGLQVLALLGDCWVVKLSFWERGGGAKLLLQLKTLGIPYHQRVRRNYHQMFGVLFNGWRSKRHDRSVQQAGADLGGMRLLAGY